MRDAETSLVVAASSFVGRHVVAHLQGSGRTVIGTTRRPGPGELFCDLTDPGSVDALFDAVNRRARLTTIYQCAGGANRQPADEVFRIHVDGTRNFLEAVHRHAPRAMVIVLGSAAEYGPTNDLPITEATVCRPVTAYGQSKLAQTNLALEMAATRNLRLAVLRPFNILGPGLGATYLASVLVRRLRESLARGETGEFPVHNGFVTRDWIDVRDVASAMQIAGETLGLPGQPEIFNVASGEETKVLDLANELCQLAGPFHAVDAGALEGHKDIDRSVGSSVKLRTRTGWSSTIAWQESLRAMWVN